MSNKNNQFTLPINSTNWIIGTISILRNVAILLRQRILREPPPVKFVVTTSAVVRETVSDEYLILLSIEAVSVVRNRQRRRYPTFAERLVVVAFEHVVLVCRHDTHAFQMIGQEITNLGVVAGCCHDPAAAERRTLEYSVGFCVRTVCKRTPIRKTAVVGIHRREFRTVCKIRIFRDNRIVFNQIPFKKRGAKAPLSIKNLDVFVLVFSPSCKASTTKLQNRKKQERLSIGRLRTSENRKMADMPFEGWQ